MLKKDDRQKQSVGRYEATRCRFEHLGNQCRLTGAISHGNGEETKYYCQFHYDVINCDGKINNFNEFEIWHKHFIDGYNIKIYGVPKYEEKTGKFLGYRAHQFYDKNTKKLWALMGNREI